MGQQCSEHGHYRYCLGSGCDWNCDCDGVYKWGGLRVQSNRMSGSGSGGSWCCSLQVNENTVGEEAKRAVCGSM